MRWMKQSYNARTSHYPCLLCCSCSGSRKEISKTFHWWCRKGYLYNGDLNRFQVRNAAFRLVPDKMYSMDEILHLVRISRSSMCKNLKKKCLDTARKYCQRGDAFLRWVHNNDEHTWQHWLEPIKMTTQYFWRHEKRTWLYGQAWKSMKEMDVFENINWCENISRLDLRR